MIEDYWSWEDSIRHTFIELVEYMTNQHSDPIEFALDFAWANGCDIFTINNAKDQLKKLKEEKFVSNESIDKLISLCEDAINTGHWKIDKSTIDDAKANLSQIRKTKRNLAEETYQAHNFATEEMNLYLETSKELGDLQKSIHGPVAYAQINDRGDLYDLRLQNNPYNDQNKIVPLYRIDHV